MRIPDRPHPMEQKCALLQLASINIGNDQYHEHDP